MRYIVLEMWCYYSLTKGILPWRCGNVGLNSDFLLLHFHNVFCFFLWGNIRIKVMVGIVIVEEKRFCVCLFFSFNADILKRHPCINHVDFMS